MIASVSVGGPRPAILGDEASKAALVLAAAAGISDELGAPRPAI